MATYIDLEDMRRRLYARRVELFARYRDLVDRADSAATAHEIDVLDRAEDEWDARVLTLMSESEARELAEIIAAIGRLDSGAYGTCQTCGTAISTARLRSVPHAAKCVECARASEPDRATYAREP